MEAIEGVIAGFPQHEVKCKIIGSGVGPMTDGQSEFAREAGAKMIVFNTMVDKRHGETVHHFKVIYELLDQIKKWMEESLPPIEVEKLSGQAEILQLFKLHSKKTEIVAGCRVKSGKVQKDDLLRAYFKDKLVWEGNSF